MSSSNKATHSPQGNKALGNDAPEWAEKLGRRYISGASSVFLLHGNVHDIVPVGDGRFLSLEEYLATQLFGRRDIVLNYDRGSGIRFLAPPKTDRRKQMQSDFTRTLHAIDTISGTKYANSRPKDPRLVLELLDRYILHKLYESGRGEADDPQRKSLAIVIRYLETITPPVEGSLLTGELGTHLIKVLNWANDPTIREADVTICLVSENLADVSRRLVENPFISKIEIPLPGATERRQYAESILANGHDAKHLSAERVANEANGLTLVGLSQAVAQARSAPDEGLAPLRAAKKSLIEKQCFGLVEFLSPKYSLDNAILPPGVTDRLSVDIRLFRAGRHEALPMGYLLCGGIGTGKTFTATCFAGSLGIPALVFKNLRSKWVGSSEGNLQKVLSVVKALGPVVVIVDEADAALGNRRASGDSGTGARMFAMIATLMSDTHYRGRILWMLLTARPDLLPVDLKRQGRCEVHIPLFPPSTDEARHDMLMAMARKSGLSLSESEIPDIPAGLSGADIESLMVQSLRAAAIEASNDEGGKTDGKVHRRHLEEAIASFIPPDYGLAKELQKLVAIRECTDRRFLPEILQAELTADKTARLEARIEEIKTQLGEH